MITLYTFGPNFELPDPSPFVMKAMVLLTMSGLPFTTDSRGFGNAPKGKLPYLRDGDTVVADSTLIRWHLEKAHGIDFDAGYGPAENATGWAVEKMLEDHLYWAIVHARWVDDANFAGGPANFFKAVPAPVRPLIQAVIRRKVRKNLHGHGLGRHSKAEIEAMGLRSIGALADILGDKPYLLGSTPSGSDATAYAFIAGLLCPVFETPLRGATTGRANLVAYERRMRERYCPEAAGEAA